MPVNILQRENLDFAEGLIPDILHDLICHLVIAYIHQPLGQRCNQCTYSDPYHNPDHSREIYIAGTDNIINRISRQFRDIQCKSHRDCCQENGKYDKNPVFSKMTEYFFQRSRLSLFLLIIIHLSFCLFISHLPAPPPGTGNNRFPDMQDRMQAVPHASRFLPLHRRPVR